MRHVRERLNQTHRYPAHGFTAVYIVKVIGLEDWNSTAMGTSRGHKAVIVRLGVASVSNGWYSLVDYPYLENPESVRR